MKFFEESKKIDHACIGISRPSTSNCCMVQRKIAWHCQQVWIWRVNMKGLFSCYPPNIWASAANIHPIHIVLLLSVIMFSDFIFSLFLLPTVCSRHTGRTKTKQSKSTCSPPSCKKWRPNSGHQFLVGWTLVEDGFSANWFRKIISSCYTKNHLSSWLPS